MIHDNRIDCIRSGTKNNNLIIVLGSNHFQPSAITQETCAKSLHIFIDITEWDMEKLHPVLMKPEEEEEVEIQNLTGSHYSTSWRLFCSERQRVLSSSEIEEWNKYLVKITFCW